MRILLVMMVLVSTAFCVTGCGEKSEGEKAAEAVEEAAEEAAETLKEVTE